MKLNRSFVWAFVLLVLVAALYRLMPNRPLGFAPQIAMALFGGAMIKDRKWAISLPLLSMLISDILFEVLFQMGQTEINGFYSGQFINYLLFAGIAVLGFSLRHVNVKNVLGYSLLAPTVYFVASNFLVWISGGGFSRPFTFAGLMQCYVDAIPFYQGSVMATMLFSALLFGGYQLITKPTLQVR
jgi:hypothetical protein